ncbi:MAG: MotA/TolQ/ExbB proton channel family protein [Proteobacteria bacterium]|nr:MotA/TolQ/ExbB proton channel family protein [Pseudomonadota bacterium]MBU1717004.1 MotA/TolQ/ExbB proton channel family protein [Pseudomonadota bacterium]
MLKQLKIYYLFVSLPFVSLLIGAMIFFDAIKSTIIRNPHPQINYTIFVIIICGGLIILFNAHRLMREAKILLEFSKAIHAKTDLATLRKIANGYTGDLACLSQMVATSGDRSISHQEQAALEHELSNVRSRLNRRNALPQYLTGLLVGMGLLGTFIGLLATLNDISVLIGSFADIDMGNANPIEVFRVMIERMKAPMRSMGIAFSASLFGLLGSIILGLMMVGLRRLQNDIFAVLSSEIARHIEIALSFESISYRGREVSSGDLSTDILLRIDERMAEAARVRQRALSSEIDDFKKQRADMVRALTEQTEASNNFRSELQKLGSQLGTIFNSMEKGSGAMSAQISELTVQMAGGTKETQKLLVMQVDEQKRLRDTIGSYNIEERLAESARMQQRALATEIDDFKTQRADMLRTLNEQTEASNNFRTELQQLGSQFGTFFSNMEKGSGEISAQISELTVHLAADAKKSHILLGNANNSFRIELQQLATQLASQLGTISNVMEQGNNGLAQQISELTSKMASETKGSQDQRGEMLRTLVGQVEASNNFRQELQQLGSQLAGQLSTIANVMEQGNGGLAQQISELTSKMAGEAKGSQDQRSEMLRRLAEQLDAGNNFRNELQQLGSQLDSQLGTISSVMAQGNGELARQISELAVKMAGDAKGSHDQRRDILRRLAEQLEANNNSRNELQQLGGQLGSQLGTISNVMAKSTGEISAQIAELLVNLVPEAKEIEKPLVVEVDENIE